LTDHEHDPFAASPAVISDDPASAKQQLPELDSGQGGRTHWLVWIAFGMGGTGVGFVMLPLAWWVLPAIWFPVAFLLWFVGLLFSRRKSLAIMAIAVLAASAYVNFHLHGARQELEQEAAKHAEAD